MKQQTAKQQQIFYGSSTTFRLRYTTNDDVAFISKEGFGGFAAKTLPPLLQRAVIANPMSAEISGEATS